MTDNELINEIQKHCICRIESNSWMLKNVIEIRPYKDVMSGVVEMSYLSAVFIILGTNAITGICKNTEIDSFYDVLYEVYKAGLDEDALTAIRQLPSL